MRGRRGAAGGRGPQVRVGVGRQRSDAVAPVTTTGHTASRRRSRAARGSSTFHPALCHHQLPPPLLLMLLDGCRTPSGTDDSMWYVGESQDGVHHGGGSDRKLTIGHRTRGTAMKRCQRAVDHALMYNILYHQVKTF